MYEPLTSPKTKRAAVIGLGMIGGSVASALKAKGWVVAGSDAMSGVAEEAAARGLIDSASQPTDEALVVVATPVAHIVDTALVALSTGAVVTDVGSVKAGVVSAIDHPNFVGGHPMAGSEKSGLDGVNPTLFNGATWVLTPGVNTDDSAYLLVRDTVAELGANVVTLDAAEHDEIVATVSHVPHLAASLLMAHATQKQTAHEVLLRLAAGGFRDMTRIAAGHPELWTDIVFQNREPILRGLASLEESVSVLRADIESMSRGSVQTFLADAAVARKELPLRQNRPAHLSIVAVVIPDRPGAMVEVLSLMSEEKVNVEDISINHAIEGGRGTFLLTVAAESAERGRDRLVASGFTVSLEAL